MKSYLYLVALALVSFSGAVRADLLCYENTPVYNFSENNVSTHHNIQPNIMMQPVKTETVLRNYSNDSHAVLEYYKNKKLIQYTLKKIKNGIFRDVANLVVVVNQTSMYHY